MTFKRFFWVALLLVCRLPLLAQSGSDVLFTVGNTPVTVDEFKYIYEKNNANDKNLYSSQNLKDYLNLYTNFKLKVQEAHDLGMDTTSKFLTEYNRYRAQLAQPYLTDREVTSQLINEAYDRMKYEVHVSHILFTLAPDAAPKDTLAAWNQAMDVRKQLLNGGDFETLARKYSKDPSVQNNAGDLGYFTVFQMIYPFETAAYNLKNKGDISMPVRTQFGYHLIKLLDRRPYRGEITVRHMLVSVSTNDPKDKQELAQRKIDSLYSQLQHGKNFADLAKEYSDHSQSKNVGGELPPFNSFAQFPEEFKDAAFALQKDGDYSKPFKTGFGWHIVQRISLKPLQPEKELEEYIKSRIARDSRSEKSQEAAIAKFKKQFNFSEDASAYSHFAKLVDTSLLKGNWTLTKPKKATKTLFTLDGKAYTQKDFADYLKENEISDRYTDLNYALKSYYTDWVNKAVLAHQDQSLEKNYADFRNVAQEYREGILLFAITDQKVWTKAMTDTLGLQAFFENHRDNYMWKQRADAVVLDLRDKAAVADVKKQLAAGKSADDIAAAYQKKDPLSINLKKGTFEKGELPVLDKVNWAKGTYDIASDNRYYVIQVNKVLPPARKDLKDIRGMVIADYQDYLEKEWISKLKSKYEVKVNQDVLNKLVKNN
jgi:peptidyl-prolyl cis-trans isomerase SurA